MNEQLTTLPPHHSIALKVEALSSLFRILALLFTYPSKEQVLLFASREFLDGCQEVLHKASIASDLFAESYTRLKKDANKEGQTACDTFRAEYTRLFIAHPLRISLKGSAWIKKRGALSQQKGEAYSVGYEYRQLGLKHKKEVRDSFDHLVSELDYMSYLADAEAKAWDKGDVASACEWRELGNSFMEQHLFVFALGVSSNIQGLSQNRLMILVAALLEAVTKSDYYLPERGATHPI